METLLQQSGWLAMAFGMATMWLMARPSRYWWAPWVGLVGQVFWAMLALVTGQPALWIGVVGYGANYIRVGYHWWRQYGECLPFLAHVPTRHVIALGDLTFEGESSVCRWCHKPLQARAEQNVVPFFGPVGSSYGEPGGSLDEEVQEAPQARPAVPEGWRGPSIQVGPEGRGEEA